MSASESKRLELKAGIETESGRVCGKTIDAIHFCIHITLYSIDSMFSDALSTKPVESEKCVFHAKLFYRLGNIPCFGSQKVRLYSDIRNHIFRTAKQRVAVERERECKKKKKKERTESQTKLLLKFLMCFMNGL